MALIRWEPFREMNQLRRQMDRLFEDLAQAGNPSDLAQGLQAAWVPAVELEDKDSELVLKAELPGLSANDLDIQVTRDAVSIAGENRQAERTGGSKGSFRSEFRYGRFQRIVPLPTQVQNNQVKADLSNGILTLTLPKVEAEQQRVFKVNLAGETAAPATDTAIGHNADEAQTIETTSVMQ